MRLRNPALEFGPPTTFESAVRRLPPLHHHEHSGAHQKSAYSDDELRHFARIMAEDPEDISHLRALRRVLQMATGGTLYALYERMVPLTEDDIRLMERWSFRRDLPPFFISPEKTFIRSGTYWSQVYDQDHRDQDYGDWYINNLNPAFPPDQLPKFSLVCIRFEGHQPDEFPYNVGPVLPTELVTLLKELQRFNKNEATIPLEKFPSPHEH